MDIRSREPIRGKLNTGITLIGGSGGELPTKVSQLENDAGYTTRQEVDTQLSGHTSNAALHVTEAQTSRWDNKLDTAASPVEGHFAGLDAQGHVIDGGAGPADFKTVCIAETLSAADWTGTQPPFQPHNDSFVEVIILPIISLFPTESGEAGANSAWPDNVAAFTAKPFDTRVNLTWEDPEDTIADGQILCKWAGTKILRKVGNPSESQADGVQIVDNKVRRAYQSTPFIDTGLLNNTTYYYTAFPYSDAGIYNRNGDNTG